VCARARKHRCSRNRRNVRSGFDIDTFIRDTFKSRRESSIPLREIPPLPPFVLQRLIRNKVDEQRASERAIGNNNDDNDDALSCMARRSGSSLFSDVDIDRRPTTTKRIDTRTYRIKSNRQRERRRAIPANATTDCAIADRILRQRRIALFLSQFIESRRGAHSMIFSLIIHNMCAVEKDGMTVR